MFAAGQRAVGHEFHRTTVEFAAQPQSALPQPAWLLRTDGAEPVREGAVSAGVHASYLHTHPAAQPESIARFVERAVTDSPALGFGR